ncbi:Rieske 2Fe-2S domain-containing protein [Saccharomonospora xinjiangensis]|uniref:cytochrome bc1 complex Rieske iron-sulfur subunit n=1 Tax=Saccharomonospora xinjiangensis TaxID=75294 RepID=UPI00106F6768|nr:Rieske 2Fe-2S domain-containing protein [Saccharomonospora xinjiangensis]QBQ60968.1 Arsenite oxidase subunit AioB precursor [Saccharomonospora xinjiangensis]
MGSDRDELLRHGAELDGVEIVEYEPSDRHPLSPRYRRGRLLVLASSAVTVIASVAAAVVYLAWPWRYVTPGDEGHTLYRLYTPLLGTLLGLAVLGLAAALLLTAKRLLPREVSVQRRHLENGSTAEDRATFAATVADAQERTGLRRRSVFGRAMAVGAGTLGVSLGIVGVGAFVRDPWDRRTHTTSPEDTLWHTGWHSPDGETVYLRMDTGEPTEVVLVRPEDLAPGSTVPVFPFRESERDNPEALAKVFEESDNPATLYRLPEGTVMAERAERAGLNYRDYYAYSRLCTHLGCPVGMFETATRRLMCPCHQSQFDLTAYARPTFGPAARALPQLPIALHPDGHFVATGDFTGPVGPGFWELG